MATLYYVHDPMCSWCWGFAKTWADLKEQLPEQLKLQYLVGGLAPDTDEPMPAKIQGYVQETWRRVEATCPSVTFNFDFWEKNTPRRATYPACRAVIAAKNQQAEAAMINAIQQAYYQRAMNPSEHDVLTQLAVELGLNKKQFAADLVSTATEHQLQKELDFARGIGADSFPSLVMVVGNAAHHIPINYHSAETMLRLIQEGLTKSSGNS